MVQKSIEEVTDGNVADVSGIARFRDAMAFKLAVKRHEGRGGWNKPAECNIDDLRAALKKHVDKGDMVDVGNYAMMIWNREHPEG